MTHLLVIGFSKAIPGKGLSKNKPKRRCMGAVWKLDAPGYGLLVFDMLQCFQKILPLAESF